MNIKYIVACLLVVCITKQVEAQKNKNLYNQIFLNVKDFGVKGDGKTNDAAALQKAVNQSSQLNKTLFIPAGKYYISKDADLQIPKNVKLNGQGKENTIIFTDSLTTKEHPSLIVINGDSVTIQNISFSGGRPIQKDQKSTSSKGRYNIVNISFDTKQTNHILLENCRFMDGFGRGIIFRANSLTINKCEFLRLGRYNTKFEAVDGAVSNFGRNECLDVTITNNSFSYVGTHAISSWRINGLRINDNEIKYISGIGIANLKSQNVQVNGNRISFTGDNGIDFQRSTQVAITNNYFYCAGDKNAGGAGSAAAIFYGDDYNEQGAYNAVIANNFIRGTYSYLGKSNASKFQNCGIYIIDVSHVKVHHNTIEGIGETKELAKSTSREDGNGIMIVNSGGGSSRDIIISENSISSVKKNGIYVNGQSRELKVVANNVDAYGQNGIYFSAVGTNLFGGIFQNTVTNGKNILNMAVTADVFVEAKNAWITNLSIKDNQLKNTVRNSFANRNDTVFTTHGIYFNAIGFGKINNLIVADNQINGHITDEIGFAPGITSYFVTADKPTPLIGFKNNITGSTDDQPSVIVPGYNQAQKPLIISESFAANKPDYGNFSKGSVVKNYDPSNGILQWVAVTSGFAASQPWKPLTSYQKGKTAYLKDDVYLCIKDGKTASKSIVPAKGVIKDGNLQWQYMGKRAVFKAIKFSLSE